MPTRSWSLLLALSCSNRERNTTAPHRRLAADGGRAAETSGPRTLFDVTDRERVWGGPVQEGLADVVDLVGGRIVDREGANVAPGGVQSVFIVGCPGPHDVVSPAGRGERDFVGHHPGGGDDGGDVRAGSTGQVGSLGVCVLEGVGGAEG